MDHTSLTVDKEENLQEEVPMGRALAAQKDDTALLYDSLLDAETGHQTFAS